MFIFMVNLSTKKIKCLRKRNENEKKNIIVKITSEM